MKTSVTKKRIVNGVDVDKLFDTIEAIKETPSFAKFKFRANNKWINAGHNHTTIKDFFGVQKDIQHEKPFELDAGEHPVLLSEDEGPNPVEYLLTALAGCLTSALVYHAAAKGIEIRGVRSRLEGDIDLRGFLGISPNVKVGYENIRVFFDIDADISDEQRDELIRMAQKFSPVFNTVFHETPVEVKLEK
ncbi:MAG: OsmC family peroxiredoxin [Candidatus Abyssobacteria bacterium SURF_5]|uniref:OsmC family peroxiredoxin n=1 Tax=Abyssobacteria bacterium (strain SURF_5) TaxID=2093360 RepID=A0A3A4N7Q7_ABYX5|nr:MAG: OsmC family peroxiredoxin [Candidatus Abyssubacteria bacterium SURF_5]